MARVGWDGQIPDGTSDELFQSRWLVHGAEATANQDGSIDGRKNSERDKYKEFFKELGDILKEGPRLDWNNREKIADLFLFESLQTPAGKTITLAQYVEGMPADAEVSTVVWQ